MVTEEKTLVASINDDGVIPLPSCLQKIDKDADRVVDAGDAAQIIFDVALVIPIFKSASDKPCGGLPLTSLSSMSPKMRILAAAGRPA